MLPAVDAIAITAYCHVDVFRLGLLFVFSNLLFQRKIAIFLSTLKGACARCLGTFLNKMFVIERNLAKLQF